VMCGVGFLPTPPRVVVYLLFLMFYCCLHPPHSPHFTPYCSIFVSHAHDTKQAEAAAAPTHEDVMNRLPLLRATVDETLRLFPAAPLTMRTARKDDVIDGYKIPAGTVNGDLIESFRCRIFFLLHYCPHTVAQPSNTHTHTVRTHTQSFTLFLLLHTPPHTHTPLNSSSCLAAPTHTYRTCSSVRPLPTASRLYGPSQANSSSTAG
jgi:hypothetical protein